MKVALENKLKARTTLSSCPLYSTTIVYAKPILDNLTHEHIDNITNYCNALSLQLLFSENKEELPNVSFKDSFYYSLFKQLQF